MNVLRRLLGVSPKESQPVMKNKMPHKHDKKPMLQCLEDYLMAHYEFRFNVLTEQVEYRPKEGEDKNGKSFSDSCHRIYSEKQQLFNMSNDYLIN